MQVTAGGKTRCQRVRQERIKANESLLRAGFNGVVLGKKLSFTSTLLGIRTDAVGTATLPWASSSVAEPAVQSQPSSMQISLVSRG